MASPQKENGYLQIATEIIEALAKNPIPLSDHEWKILMFLFRKTYGWKRTSDQISFSQFAQGTNSHRSHACRAMKKLIQKNMVTVTQIGNTQDLKYSFQKDHEKWSLLPNQVTLKPVDKSVDNPKTLLPKQVTELLPKQDATVTKTTQKLLPKQVTTIDTTKDTNKRNNKKDENQANLEEILATMVQDIKNFKSLGNSEQWIKNIYMNLGVPEAKINEALGKLF